MPRKKPIDGNKQCEYKVDVVVAVKRKHGSIKLIAHTVNEAILIADQMCKNDINCIEWMDFEEENVVESLLPQMTKYVDCDCDEEICTWQCWRKLME